MESLRAEEEEARRKRSVEKDIVATIRMRENTR
jgi:hypothetical protein